MISIQDISAIPNPVPENSVVVFHTHGFRQAMGTCKLHLSAECPHLVHWNPAHVLGGRAQLGKVLMRTCMEREHIVESMRCKTCWKTPRTGA